MIRTTAEFEGGPLDGQIRQVPNPQFGDVYYREGGSPLLSNTSKIHRYVYLHGKYKYVGEKDFVEIKQ